MVEQQRTGREGFTDEKVGKGENNTRNDKEKRRNAELIKITLAQQGTGSITKTKFQSKASSDMSRIQNTAK